MGRGCGYDLFAALADFSGKHRNQCKVPATDAEARERVIHSGVEADGDQANAPDGIESGANAPDENDEHETSEWDAAFRRPFEPIVVRLIYIGAVVVVGKHAIDGHVRFESPAG